MPAIDREYLVNILRDMVQIDSVNSELVPGGAGEGELARYLGGKMRELGLDVDVEEVLPGRPNIVGTLKGRGGGKSLMLNGHTDTVGIQGMAEPLSGDIRDGKLYGRGAFDMKASLAASLAVAKALIDGDVSLAGDLVLAMVIDEEYHSAGTEAVIKSHPVNGAIVTEPTGLRLCVAHRGFCWFDIETIGRAAHGSRYQDGVDANRLMGYFLVELDKYATDLLKRNPHPLLGTSSIHAPLIKGGSSQSVYAARCLTELEYRLLPGETPQQVQAELQNILDKLSETVSDFKATIKQTFSRSAYETSPESDIAQTVINAYQKHAGTSPEIYGELWWMDSALLADAGIETVIIGPTGAGAHADEEWVELDSVFALAGILTEATIQYCS